MTQGEKATIRAAINELMNDDGDFSAGIAMLSQLVGIDYAPARVLRGAKVADLRKLACGPNQAFSVSEATAPEGQQSAISPELSKQSGTDIGTSPDPTKEGKMGE